MDVNVTIEIPKGERDKHELDHHNGRMKLDRTLFATLTQARRLEGRPRPVCGPPPDPSQAKAVAPSMLGIFTTRF
jgi:inorganic pyrophosphatase